jgi:hypothetical protein
MNIPKMNSTEDAIRVGREMSQDMIQVFIDLNHECAAKAKQLRLEKKWDEAMEVAVQGQYFREAVEVFNGKQPPRG